jgi:hypothetical protein
MTVRGIIRLINNRRNDGRSACPADRSAGTPSMTGSIATIRVIIDGLLKIVD